MHGGEVDKMILATIQGDIIELIKLSSASFGNWWFVSHLTDLLYHLGVLESSQIKHGAQQREFLLLEYASSLFNHSSLWQLGVEYFAYCPSQGRCVY
jgi:nuclear pore complex protein Nup85